MSALRSARASRCTEELARQLEQLIREVIPPDDLAMVVSNLGLAAGFSAIYSPNAAADSGFVMVSLKPGHRRSSFYYVDKLRRLLPEKVPELQTFFQSGSIIDAVLNFGLAAPIDVQLSGPDYDALYPLAGDLQRHCARCPRSPIPSFPKNPATRPSTSGSIGSRRHGSA